MLLTKIVFSYFGFASARHFFESLGDGSAKASVGFFVLDEGCLEFAVPLCSDEKLAHLHDCNGSNTRRNRGNYSDGWFAVSVRVNVLVRKRLRGVGNRVLFRGWLS